MADKERAQNNTKHAYINTYVPTLHTFCAPTNNSHSSTTKSCLSKLPSNLPSNFKVSDVGFPELGLGKGKATDIGKDKGKSKSKGIQSSVEVGRAVGKGSGSGSGVGVGVGVGVRAGVSTRVGGQQVCEKHECDALSTTGFIDHIALQPISGLHTASTTTTIINDNNNQRQPHPRPQRDQA